MKLRLLLSLVIDQESESVLTEPDHEAALALEISARSSAMQTSFLHLSFLSGTNVIRCITMY